MAALLVLLLLLAVPPTAFTTTDVYYVTAHDAAGHEQSCPPHQICHNLSYYISQPDSYFTNDTAIIFLEGEHSFDREDLVHVSNVHNLTLKGQGQWPVAGAEETVMQSTVIINCIRGRGGFYFGTSHNITVEGLTVVNCGGVKFDYCTAVFYFFNVQSLFFHKNSIQHMTGYGLFVLNCDNVIVTNCSYYHSALCNISDSKYGGGVGIVYDTQYSNTGYTLELSHSNMTKCCNPNAGGGLYLGIHLFGQAKVLFNHLKLSHNKASTGGGISAYLHGNGNLTLVVSNCVLFNGFPANGGGIHMDILIQSGAITIENTDFVDNNGEETGEVHIYIDTGKYSTEADVTFSMLNSTVYHTKTYSGYGVHIEGCCASVQLTNTSMRFVNVHFIGFLLFGTTIREHGSVSLCRDGQKTKWRLQCKY